jgi:cytochrome c-type biogenesis protein CcmE
MMKTKRAKDEHVPRRSRTKGRTQERVTVVADPHRMMMLCGGAVRQRDEVLYKPSSVERREGSGGRERVGGLLSVEGMTKKRSEERAFMPSGGSEEETTAA